MTEHESRVQYWKGSVLVTRALESCPCCGGNEWKQVNRWDGYGMTCYECVVCGFQVVE